MKSFRGGFTELLGGHTAYYIEEPHTALLLRNQSTGDGALFLPSMPNRSEILEKVAQKARYLRDLERSLIATTDPRGTLDRLKRTREELDELLDDLDRSGR